MTQYKIEGYYYQGRHGSWWWRYRVERLGPDTYTTGRLREHGVKIITEEWRWMAALKARLAIIADRRHQRLLGKKILITKGRR